MRGRARALPPAQIGATNEGAQKAMGFGPFYGPLFKSASVGERQFPATRRVAASSLRPRHWTALRAARTPRRCAHATRTSMPLARPDARKRSPHAHTQLTDMKFR
jgi:hypothetical protein